MQKYMPNKNVSIIQRYIYIYIAIKITKKTQYGTSLGNEYIDIERNWKEKNLCISFENVRKESFPESERTTNMSFPSIYNHKKARHTLLKQPATYMRNTCSQMQFIENHQSSNAAPREKISELLKENEQRNLWVL